MKVLRVKGKSFGFSIYKTKRGKHVIFGIRAFSPNEDASAEIIIQLSYQRNGLEIKTFFGVKFESELVDEDEDTEFFPWDLGEEICPEVFDYLSIPPSNFDMRDIYENSMVPHTSSTFKNPFHHKSSSNNNNDYNHIFNYVFPKPQLDTPNSQNNSNSLFTSSLFVENSSSIFSPQPKKTKHEISPEISPFEDQEEKPKTLRAFLDFIYSPKNQQKEFQFFSPDLIFPTPEFSVTNSVASDLVGSTDSIFGSEKFQ